MTWKDRLQDASFRGVPFKVEEESAGIGRRVETHEYPNRDKPYTEDLGKITFRPSITAYVVGDDCFDQRDRLIDALNKPGPGTLVHPTYGELKVCVDGEVRVSTSKSEGRIVRFDLKFVEAGELSYPTSGAATAQTLMSSCSALDDCISDSFSGFSIDGVADFVQNDVVGNAGTMLGYVSDAMKVVDSAVSDAARLLQGDISVLLPPPSSGKNFVEQVQKMWRTGKRLYGNASDLVTMIKTLSGVSLGSDLQPRGVWKTDSKTTATATQQRNVVASILRTTAISEAAYAVTRLPAPTTSAVMQNAAVGQATTPAQSTGWPSVTHPALNNAPAVKSTVDLPTWEELTDIRDTLNTAIDKELSRTTSDALFLALRRVKADLNADNRVVSDTLILGCTSVAPEGVNAGHFQHIGVTNAKCVGNSTHGGQNATSYNFINGNGYLIVQGNYDYGNTYGSCEVENDSSNTVISGNAFRGKIWIDDSSNVTVNGNTVNDEILITSQTDDVRNVLVAGNTAKRIVVQQFGDEPVGWAYDCHIQGNLTTGNLEYEHDILLSSLISGTVENNRLNGESKYSIGIIRHHNTDLIIRNNTGKREAIISGSGGRIIDYANIGFNVFTQSDSRHISTLLTPVSDYLDLPGKYLHGTKYAGQLIPGGNTVILLPVPDVKNLVFRAISLWVLIRDPANNNISSYRIDGVFKVVGSYVSISFGAPYSVLGVDSGFVTVANQGSTTTAIMLSITNTHETKNLQVTLLPAVTSRFGLDD